jgi:hypothetical protein
MLSKRQASLHATNRSKWFDAKTALLFGIEQLPSSYLFESGILIAINPTLEEISIQLKK